MKSFLFCSFTFIGGGGLGEPASSHVIRAQFVDAHFSTMWGHRTELGISGLVAKCLYQLNHLTN